MKRLLLLLSLCFNHLAYPEGFIAGTPVKTPTEYVPIEQIKAGDQVYSYDFQGHYCIKTVILTNKQYTEALVKITVDDESFFTTPDQFFISAMFPLKWVAAIDLKIGDCLVGVGKHSNVSTIELVEACAEIYTLSVAGYGNFAVSTHDIFSHNFVFYGVIASCVGPAAPYIIAATDTIATTIEATIPYIPFVASALYRWKTSPSRPNVNRHSEHPYYNSSPHGNPWPKDTDPNSPWSRWNAPPDKNIDPNNPIWDNPQAGNGGKENPRDPAPKATTSCGGGGGKPPDDPDDPWKKRKFWSNGRPPADPTPIRSYKGAPYHHQAGNPTKSCAPLDGRAALKNSIAISEATTARRIGISCNQFVVLDRTQTMSSGSQPIEEFHGHVRHWSELTQKMQAELIKNGLTSKIGKILK